jgi:hypothetical protein
MTARDAPLQTLRLKYNAAVTAHQGCMRALTEASMAGAGPSHALVESEAKARQELERAREQLLAAMTQAITGKAAPAEPTRSAPGATNRTSGENS